VATDAEILRADALALTEEGLRAIVASTFDGIAVIDRTSRIVFENRAIERMLGHSEGERILQNAFDYVHPDDLVRARATFADLVTGRVDHVRTEIRVRHKDGSYRALDSIATNLLDNPNVRGLVVVARDVTEQRLVEIERLQLLASERDARAAAEHALDQLLSLQSVAEQLSAAESPEMVASVIVTHSRLPLGAVACRVAVLDAVGKHLVNLGVEDADCAVPSEWHKFPVEAQVPMADVVRTGEALWFESLAAWSERFPSTVPRSAHLRSTAVLPVLVSGRVGGAIAWIFGEDRVFSENERLFMRVLARQCGQALDRARLYQAVGERERRLHDLVRRLLAGHEEERRRVAYELHDGLAQVAAGAHQHLQVLASRYPPESAEQREELNRAIELAQRTVREARNLISGLRPTVLDDFGLARAMHVEIEAMAAEGWQVSFDERLGTTRLPQPIEIALFRALQEALSNVRKHAGETRVHVALRRRGGAVHLSVRDWGRGFRQGDGRQYDSSRGSHVGLVGMHERVSLLGGRCVIRARPGHGTVVDVNVPLPELSRANSDVPS